MKRTGSRRRPWLLRSAIPINRDDFPPYAERVIPFPPNWVLLYTIISSSLFALHLRFLPPMIAYCTLAAPFVLFFYWIIINLVRSRRLMRRAQRAGLLLCTGYGYDMRNSIGQWKCPECGHPWEHEDAMRRWGVFTDARFSASDQYDLSRRTPRGQRDRRQSDQR